MPKKYAFQVKVPSEGPLNREQGWAALSNICTQMGNILHRMKDKFEPEVEQHALPEDEQQECRNVKDRLTRLVNRMEKDVLDQLADIGDEDDDGDDYYDTAKYSPYMRWMLDDHVSDVYRFTREFGGEPSILAFALLQQDGWDNEKIGELIRKECAPDSKYSRWHSCPLCDDHEPGYIDHKQCRNCYGWGYVHGEKPDYGSYPESLKGRQAVHDGKPWTDEQEKIAWSREIGDVEEDE